MSELVSEYIDVLDGFVKIILGKQSIQMFTAVHHLKVSKKLSDQAVRAIRQYVPRIPRL